MAPKYDFDTVINRSGTSCLKYDFGMARMGRDDLLPLWVADMDFALPDEVLDDIISRTRHGIFGYTDPDRAYYEAVRGWYQRRHGYTIKDEWITIAPGVVYAIACAVKAFTGPGDAVIIQQPVYYPFAETVDLNGRKLVNNQLVYKDGCYSIDFDDLEKKIVDNDVRLFIFCSPHNPVGRVWTKDELIKLADICIKHGVYIFADEIHSDFVYPGYKHTSFMTLGDKYTEKLILGTSPSKTFNIAGLQVANVIIPDETTRKTYRKESFASGYSQGNTLGLVATTSVYTKGEEWLDELLLYLWQNISYVRDFVKDNLPDVRFIEPEGTYLVWLDFSAYTDNRDDLKRLIVDEAKLWLDPGIIFGRETALFERINIACPRSLIIRAMEQLNEAVKRRKR
ncbi:MAG: pyridoxal phosphate-dependent aminotransferase [Lachnospiraceae bacterium]|nr:pyridoxal phosphate-dependent aminotransferase [Lachnospiraceae bacterium]